ncbi:hypothetical protein HYH03_013249 [Edaphochlamys debaryana]|uniref:Uncharacterized protein n=1 Tax=Edaphochlamys debaryana TaxID=47281 RepID=A0A835XQY5_9CHLO|nr:hypothetical protein HYH03_013249 [Edaphochlamys debaryana]|eukprot:KAG2488099.1 hypothetical protein HYH03_013249 [Edaphochlamys debaryana]
MQGNAVSGYMPSYAAPGGAYGGHQPGAPPNVPIEVDAVPPVPQELLPPPEADARGQLCCVQLPVGAASPSASAWCPVSNLVAVALTPEPGSSVAQILVLEPSNPEDCTTLELPATGPHDCVTHLEWSWPGQRRALLGATASGRVVVWTQPSQQGQDDQVYPRVVDDWHGQLLMDVGGGGAGPGGPADSQGGIKQEPGGRPAGTSSTGNPSLSGLSGPADIKPEPGTTAATDPDGAGAGTAGIGSGSDAAGEPGSVAGAAGGAAALAGVCWLRQPSAGRVWCTSLLAMKRLDAASSGSAGPGQAPGGPPFGSGGQQPENFDSLFAEESLAPGWVPHWARPSQLTAAVLTAGGDLTILWSLASKLPNQLAWFKSRPLRLPPPPDLADGMASALTAAGPDAGPGAVGAAGAAAAPRVACASMCATHDGALAAAVVYGNQRDAVHMYDVRGNPTLGGQPLAAAAAAVAAAAAAGREVPPVTAAHRTKLQLDPGWAARHCRLTLSAGATKRAYVLAQPLAADGAAGSATAAAAAAGPATVIAYSDQPVADGGWRRERHSAPLDLHCAAAGAAAAAAAAAGAGAAAGPAAAVSVSVDGSKVAAAVGGGVYVMDSETMTLLAAQAPAELASCDPSNSQPPTANGLAAGAPAPPPLTTSLAAAACLSANSCCLATAARIGPAQDPTAGSTAAAGAKFGLPDVAAADGAASSVVLLIRTLPDVVPPSPGSTAAAAAAAAAAGGGGGASFASVEDVIACNMDTMRLAWGMLHRLSLWDVAERLRQCWLAGRTEHVATSLSQLDVLLYGHEEISIRSSMATGVSRAKLEVLRRIPHPRAALLAADLLAAARVVQYSQALALLYSQADVLNHPETKALAAHMVWFVFEVLTLMLAGLRLWSLEYAQAGQDGTAGPGNGAAGPDGGSGGPDMIPLIRLYPDHVLYKYMQMALLPAGSTQQAAKGADGRQGTVTLHPAVQELLGGPTEAASNHGRLKTLMLVMVNLQKRQATLLQSHVQGLLALQKGQQQNGGAPPGPTPGLLPGAPMVHVTAADEHSAKSHELPRVFLAQVAHGLFQGPFHYHFARCKGLILTPNLSQLLRGEDVGRALQSLLGGPLTRETYMERYRCLGLQGQLVDPRDAPYAAARRLWMSFRAPAPAPELHSHVLTQHVSSRQRLRWRRQRAAALALGSSAPLWANANGVPVDCLTSAPLPPGTSWSLEGAEAATATAQMGPGVGAAGARRGLPPLMAALQRAWVSCAPPIEMGSGWKRARLGLEMDMEY